MKVYAYEKQHIETLQALAPGCAVLLKTDGSFPLAAPCPVALYGSGARHTVKGGTGSGEVNSRFFPTVEQALEYAGFTVTTKTWLDGYDAVLAAAKVQFVKDIKARAKQNHTNAITEGMGAVMPQPDCDLPLDGAGDTAVYVLSRICGEGNDRQPVPGDVLLSASEQRDILALQAQYKRFLLVLNVGGPVDLGPVAQVGNILLLSQLGVVTGHVLADLLLGKSYPSGKLTTTWAPWEDYQQIGDFGGHDDTRYTEGIYVGYRYFDSVGKRAMFPFGYGLGYTTFAVTPGAVQADGETVTVQATVQNTGARPGRETVQLYVSVPSGALDQPYQTLAAFAKTAELAPGESAGVSLRFAMHELAGYDTANSRWLLEKGSYLLRLGTSSADTVPCGAVRLAADVPVLQYRPCGGAQDFADWRPKTPTPTGTVQGLPVVRVRKADIPTGTVVYDAEPEVDPAVQALTDEQLAYLNTGAFAPKAGVLSVIGSASQRVAGAAGESYGGVPGIPPLVMADGPAGVRLSPEYYKDEKGAHSLGPSLPATVFEFMPGPLGWLLGRLGPKPPKTARIRHQYATAVPIGTAIAQSWDPALAEACGDIVGTEMERFGVQLWLAPALNIHRSILCGRNFEYYSEDPLLSGRFAAAVARGVQAHPGCGVTVKHFAANNQEYNRYNSNSQVSERALREIYLRGFGICVREGAPAAVMTSYNLLNGVHTSERRDLAADILRAEFGFDGILMTDWIVAMMADKTSVHPDPDAARIAAAGGDLVMPGSQADYAAILQAVQTGTLPRRQLEENATRLLRTAQGLQK